MRFLSFIIILCISAASVKAADERAVNVPTNGGFGEELYRYTYIEAVRQQDEGHYVAAMEMYRRCLKLNPDAAEANYALGTFYLALQKDTLGILYLKHATELEPSNTEYADRLAQAYLMQNDIDNATLVYEKLSTAHPDRTDYLDILINIYQKQHEWKKMLAALDRMEVQEGESEEITLTKMQAYSNLGDQDGAYKEISGLVAAHPNDLNIRVMMGNWLLSNGKKQEALETFQKVLKDEPDNALGQMSLMDYYRTEGKSEEADKLLYNMLINPKTDRDTRISLVRSWVQDSEQKDGDSLHVIELFNKVLALPQTSPEVAEMKAAYLELKKAPSDSIKAAWQDVLDIAPEEVGARLKLIDLMWKDSIDDKVIKECQKATEYIPDEPSLYYQLGMAQYINDRYDDAIASLRKGTHCITKETKAALASDMYGALGDIYQKKGRMTEAYNAYDSCLVYNPENIMCLNNYAYFLSCENKDLKKAEQMSYKAISTEPNNGTYLDTYAWILYMEQKYEEAAIYIEQAIKNDTVKGSGAAELREHAGDIYYRLGRIDDAVGMWQKALDMNAEDAAVLRRKIQERKL